MARDPFNPKLIRVPPEERAPGAGGPVTVSQVTSLVKRAIEVGLPKTLHVVGEISNFKRHSSGHLYLTLKDRSSELSCVMWRSAAGKLKFSPDDGLEVIATGNIEVFERTGRYQLYIRKLEPRGVGSLELAFRQLCEKLEKEGLFDERRKRPLPAYPARIALVTSPTGAAVADMLRTIERRYPSVHVLVYPVRVQGPGAADEIVGAIKRINNASTQLGGIDLLIVGRGGGSLENLWAFNEEIVARAIHASRIPIISAVGHEVDISIADLVADVRAATPTAAAELAVPMLSDVLEDIAFHAARLTRAAANRAELLSTRLAATCQRTSFRQPLAVVHRREQLVDETSSRLRRLLANRVHHHRTAIDRLERIIQRIAPHSLLLRLTVGLGDLQHRLRLAALKRIRHGECCARNRAWRIERASPINRIRQLRESVNRIDDSLPMAMAHRFSMLDGHVRRHEDVLAALSYKSVLGRGFSLTQLKKGGRVVRSLKEVKDRERIVTEVGDGKFEADVVNLNQQELFG